MFAGLIEMMEQATNGEVTAAIKFGLARRQPGWA